MTEILEIEQRRLTEQVRLDQQKSPAERNRWGQFATPPSLSLDIAGFVRALWRPRRDRVRFLDPAIGTGSFYAALRAIFSDDEIEAASGIELDRSFAEVARGLWSQTGLDVRAGDFTKQRPPTSGEQFNLILTNPPYVRHHHLDTEEKERLKAGVFHSLGIEISGLAGLYCYFLLLAHDWLVDDGIAAWLIPTEFMTVNYGSAVRRYLTELVTLLRVHRFCPSDVQFADALVSSVIVVFEKRPPIAGQSAEFSFGGSLLNPQTCQQVSIDDLRRSDRWTDFPRDDTQRARRDESSTLGDLFTIKRGLATGANDFFIIPRRQALELEIAPQFLIPILPSPRYLDQTVIESDSDGYPRLPEPLALILATLPSRNCDDPFRSFGITSRSASSEASTGSICQATGARGIHRNGATRHRSSVPTWVAPAKADAGHFDSSGTNPRLSQPTCTCCSTLEDRSRRCWLGIETSKVASSTRSSEQLRRRFSAKVVCTAAASTSWSRRNSAGCRPALSSRVLPSLSPQRARCLFT